jgi:hypothetical protein
MESENDVRKKYQVFSTEAERGGRNVAFHPVPFNHQDMRE